MGNKLGTFVTKRTKKLKKEIKVVTSKLTSFEINKDDEDDDDNEVYLSPKSHQSQHTDDQELIDFNYDVRVLETGQSSNSETDDIPSFICAICVDSIPLHDSFNVKGCTHFYCTLCMIKYITSKLDDNLTCITCPVSDCEGVLEFEYCRFILPYDVFVRWGDALCKSAIVDSNKFYCPYRDCSAMLINEGGQRIKQSNCPFCDRLFCVECKVPWHTEFGCSEFQKLQKRSEEAVMTDLAKKKKWRRCPKCKYFVEKSSGCSYIKCRCGYAFCYDCGARSSSTSHTCSKCKH